MIRPAADYSTGTGEVASFDLPDRSRLRLSTATALSLEFNAESRRLHLFGGKHSLKSQPTIAPSQ